ncbi:ABC transporter substrate-binding protein [uncultured Desulfuromusa sp.]|uniref:ABC transporter substrate-binding protein n=1 Tax=uncultured Desulfuromusa sp. TaxID=219183 RepID=UPI002AA77D64|nr:ABC transporter substrate-binding protein [uncultured Desulfuromusa sp.]
MRRVNRLLMFLGVLLCLVWSMAAEAAPKQELDKENINAIILGDRLATVAYHLGVVPEALVARCVWPAVTKGELSHIKRLGCPKRATVKDKKLVAEFAEKKGIKRILIENTGDFCRYMPDANPMNIIPLLQGKNVVLDVVDFNQGLEPAVRATGKLLNREVEAEALLGKYASDLARAKKKLPSAKLGKKVLILNGIMVGKTGKSFIQVEADGGYSDHFFLEPMGCESVGNLLMTKEKEASKGYFTLNNIADIAKADPDIIIVTGESFPVEKALAGAARKNPALNQVTALKNHEIYSLPAYMDGSVLDYPYLLMLWTGALYR